MEPASMPTSWHANMASIALSSTVSASLPAPMPLTSAAAKPHSAKATDTTPALLTMRVVRIRIRPETAAQRRASDKSSPDFAQPAQKPERAHGAGRKLCTEIELSIERKSDIDRDFGRRTKT